MWVVTGIYALALGIVSAIMAGLWARERRRRRVAEAESAAWQRHWVEHECGGGRLIYPPEGVYVRGDWPYLAVKLPDSYRIEPGVFTTLYRRNDDGTMVVTIIPKRGEADPLAYALE